MGSPENTADDPKRRRSRQGDRKKVDSGPPPTQATASPSDDGMLVIDDSGKIASLNPGSGRPPKIPEAGKTLPLNQRFARMWEIPEGTLERMTLEADLRRALNHEEFAVYLQPQADVQTNRIVGAEALVRWQHPDRGLILPDEFIPLAEESDLIVQLGEQVLRTACEQSRARHKNGLPLLRIAVNLSARQFEQPNLVDMVEAVLKETGLEPHLLELEITETTAMRHAAFAIEVLRDLRALGVEIALDDFGTGFSSLKYLKDFPIHTLKIDRSFVRAVTHEEKDAAIVSAIIAIGHSLGLKVIAEGIEDEEQLTFLKKQQCDWYQGYLLGKPMPAEAFDSMLEEQAA